jgi:hypothetical protein
VHSVSDESYHVARLRTEARQTNSAVEKRMKGEESEKACTAAAQATRVAARESFMAS